MTKDERTHAGQLSAAIDQLIRNPDAPPGPLTGDDAGLLDTARRLARLPSLLRPVDPIFERQVMGQLRAKIERPQRLPRFRAGWAVAGLVVVMLAVLALTPLGQTAVASFLAVFDLGRTEVRITPADVPLTISATAAPGGAVVREEMTLAEAQTRVSFALPRPTELPPGYHLRLVNGYSYPDLPPWMPQPFFVELVYEDDAGQTCTLRLYPITLGERASISGLNLEAAPIQDVRDVEVNGQPGVLLQLGSERGGPVWQEVVWEQGDLILALSATDLKAEELLRVARSVGR